MNILVKDFVSRHWCKCLGGEFELPSVPYYREVPAILFFGLLGSTYFLLAPLILPFLIVYFFLGLIVYRNQVISPFFLLCSHCKH